MEPPEIPTLLYHANDDHVDNRCLAETHARLAANRIKLLEPHSQTHLDVTDAYRKFANAHKRFPYERAAYHALAAQGWSVACGANYGADFVLYTPRKTGEPHSHSLHAVLVLTPLDDAGDWAWLQRHCRVCHTVGKSLVLCEVEHADRSLPPELSSLDSMARMVVRCATLCSWDPGKARILDKPGVEGDEAVVSEPT